MINKTIQCFSIDSFERSEWKLPFIRIGTTQSCNSIISDKNNGIRQFELPLSEFNGIYWINTHIKDFGNPDYIGICHYRRYFAKPINLQNIGIMQYESDLPPDMNMILYPIEQLLMIEQNKIDGIVPGAFYEHIVTQGIDPYKLSLAEYFHKAMSISNEVNLELGDIEFALQSLFNAVDTDTEKNALTKAYNERKVYFCNICTLNKKLFSRWVQLLTKILIDLFNYIDKDRFLQLHHRSIGYLIERLSSCIFHMFINCGYKFVSMPLIITNCQNNPSYRKPLTIFDANMKCDIEGFLHLTKV